MKYRYLGKHTHNLIFRDVKTVLRRGDVVELPERVKHRKMGRRLVKVVPKKEVEKEKIE